MHTNGDRSQPPSASPARKWIQAGRTGCPCTPLQKATRVYAEGCPVHQPKRDVVTAADVGLTESELLILQQLNAGDPVLIEHHPLAVDRMRDRGYIEATGDRPEDGWKLTEPGLAMVIACGSFRIDPRMAPRYSIAVTGPTLAALLAVAVGVATALLLRLLS